jgi:hypothetical protein
MSNSISSSNHAPQFGLKFPTKSAAKAAATKGPSIQDELKLIKSNSQSQGKWIKGNSFGQVILGLLGIWGGLEARGARLAAGKAETATKAPRHVTFSTRDGLAPTGLETGVEVSAEEAPEVTKIDT